MTNYEQATQTALRRMLRHRPELAPEACDPADMKFWRELAEVLREGIELDNIDHALIGLMVADKIIDYAKASKRFEDEICMALADQTEQEAVA